MDFGVISVRYARALLKSATAMKLDAEVYADMQSLAQAYTDVPQLRFTIDNPMLDRNQKKKLLETACGTHTTELSKQFLELVLNEGRESTLQLIANSFVTLYRQQKNITRGRLITATAVAPFRRNDLRDSTKNQTRSRNRCRHRRRL